MRVQSRDSVPTAALSKLVSILGLVAVIIRFDT